MFQDTQKLVAWKIAELREEIQEATDEKRYSGHTTDGDMMDDPIMHGQMERIALTQIQIIKLEPYLQPNVSFIKPTSPNQDTGIEIGHRIQLQVMYADGEKEVYFATIGTAIDHSLMGVNRKYFDGQSEVLISEDSSLGQTLLGARTNQNLMYMSPGGNNRVTILAVEVSPFAQK